MSVKKNVKKSTHLHISDLHYYKAMQEIHICLF